VERWRGVIFGRAIAVPGPATCADGAAGAGGWTVWEG
jgi:hypothetical protein